MEGHSFWAELAVLCVLNAYEKISLRRGHKKAPQIVRQKMVPRAGVEPAHPKIQDFESSASANSAIWAYPRFGNKASYQLNAMIRF